MEITIQTRNHSKYTDDLVTFEESNYIGYVKITTDLQTFEVKKTELKKILFLLSEE